MYKATVNDGKVFGVSPKLDGMDIRDLGNGRFHILAGEKSFNAVLLESESEENAYKIMVNGKAFSVSVEDEFSQLIKKLGFEKNATPKMSEIKAPMPGMVLEILVTPGQKLNKGESVLILEAMKMENVIKAATDIEIKSIHVSKGTPVEKNQVLIELA